MKRLFLVPRLVASLSVLAWLGGAAGGMSAADSRRVAPVHDGSDGAPEDRGDAAGSVKGGSSGGTLTLAGSNSYTGAGSAVNGGTVSVNGSNSNYYAGGATLTLGGSVAANTGTFFVNGGGSGRSPSLSGSAGKLHVATSADGSQIRVKSTVSIRNTGTKGAKDVTATVYLSDDAVLDPADTKLATLNLADFQPGGGHLAKGQTLSLPIKHKVPSAVAEFLNGKYLIVVLGAANETTLLASSGLTTANVTGVTSSGSQAGATNPGSGFLIGSAPGVGSIAAGALTGTTATAWPGTDLTATGIPTAGLSWAEPGTELTLGTGATLTATDGTVWAVAPGGTLAFQTGSQVVVPQGSTSVTVTGGTLTLPSGQTLTFPTSGAVLPTGTVTAISLPTGETITATGEATSATSTPTPTPTAVAVTPKNEIVIGPIELP